MRFRLLSGVMVGIACFSAAFAQKADAVKAGPSGYAIQQVCVIDVENGSRRPDCTVLIEGQSIRRIAAATEPVPAEFERVDGKGRFLIPGLFDAHVHYVDPGTYGPLCVAHGVTFVREMGASTEQILEIRNALNAGKRLGPEMICTGAILDGKPPVWPFSEACDTPDEGRAAVKKQVEAGVNQIKVYSKLKPDVYMAIADESKKRGIKFVGHVPEAVTLEEAMDAGQYTCEHFMTFGAAIARLADKPVPTTQDALESDIRGFKSWPLLATLDQKVLAGFTKRVRDSGMVQCPTLVVFEGMSRIARPEAKNDERLKYVSPTMIAFWDSEMYREFGEHAGKNMKFMQQMLLELNRAGAPLIVGTDLANPHVFAGASVHDEIELFAKSGISPADVLRAATIAPARVCGVDARLGSVSEGKTASLVLLRADPLDDPANVRQVDAVFLRGRYFDRAQLDGLMQDALKAARASDPKSIDIKVEVPGEIIARGVYKVTFNGMDAGTEEFALSRDAAGHHIMSLSLPKGGWDQPSAAKMTYDEKRNPLSAEWHEFGDVKTVARYVVKDRKIDATASVKEEKTGEQAFDIPENAVFNPPAIAADYFVHAAYPLKPGESREYQSLSFGFDSWNVAALKVTIKRLDDESLMRKDGKSVTARRYSFSQVIPGMGPVTAESWTDERGIVLKNTLKLPFGAVGWELE